MNKILYPFLFASCSLVLSEKVPERRVSIITFEDGESLSDFKISDLNGDSFRDIALLTSTGIFIFLNDGNGNVFLSDSVSFPVSVLSFSIADITNDDNDDILIPIGNDIMVLSTNSFGKFNQAEFISTHIIFDGIDSTDLNKDGHVDLLFVSTLSQVVGVRISNGDGTYQPPQFFNTSTGLSNSPVVLSSDVEKVDLNKDGAIDLVICDSQGFLVFLNNGDGTLQPASPFSAGGFCTFSFSGDFNGDSNVDIVTSTLSDVQVFAGNGDGTFEPSKQVYISPAPSIGFFISVGDINHDGLDDVAVSDSGTGDAFTLEGNADEVLLPPQIWASGVFSFSLELSDLDDDDNLDIVISDSNANLLGTLIGQGDGSFAPVTFVDAGGTPLLFSNSELNNDNSSDLVVMNIDSMAIFLGPNNR